MLAVFRYIREHLDGNEQAIWELGEQCRQFGQQQQDNNQQVQQQLQRNEENIGKIVVDAKDVFMDLQI